MKKFIYLVAIFLISAAPVFALKADSDVLAKIGDRVITRADLERIIGYYGGEKGKLLEQPEYQVTLLKRVVETSVVADVARKDGFDKNKDIKEQIGLLTNDFLATQYLKQVVVAKVTATDDEARLYYDSHRDEFKSPEMIRVRHILIKVTPGATAADKQKALDKAESILKRLKGGEDFGKLAEEFSDDPGSKSKGGDLGLLPKDRLVPQFAQAAFELKPGELGGPVLTPFGYHIIRVDEKKPAAEQPFAEVKEQARQKVVEDLRKVRLKEFIEGALKDAGVEIHPERLAAPAK